MRLSVLNAMVWRLTAEVLRRHSPKHRFSLFESHPGISARGRLHIVLRDGNRPVGACAQAIFNLGGPSGTLDLMHAGGAAGETLSFAQHLLERDPIEVVDSITRGLGLHAPPSIGPASAPTIAARVLADALARESLTRKPLRVTSGWVDTSFESGPPAWTTLVPLADDPAVSLEGEGATPGAPGLDQGSRLVALHAASPEEGPLMTIEEQPIAILDLSRGDLILAKGANVVARIALPAEFASNGRRTGPLADRLLAHMNR